MKPSDRLIIVGGGNSMAEGIEKDLWNKISKEYTFGINSSIYFYKPTIPVFCDWYFYFDNKKELDKYQLVVGKYDAKIGDSDRHKCPKGKNLIMLKHNKSYQGVNSWEKGFYGAILSGCFTLSLGIALGFKEIYLLGYDFCEIDGKTHFYQKESLKKQDIGKIIEASGRVRCGVGKDENGRYRSNCYNNPAHLHFNEFKKIGDGVKVFNVSTQSKINVFPKISYNEFFKVLEDEPKHILQHKASLEIENLIETYRKPFV